MLRLRYARNAFQCGVKLLDKNIIEVRNKSQKVLCYSSPITVRFVSTGINLEKTIDLVEKSPETSISRDVFGDVTNVVQTLTTNSEPSFSSLGLGGWGPVGIIQNCFEFLHVTLDVPWWGAIVIGTVVVRSLIFPLVIKTQRNAVAMNNHLPELMLIQMKITEARKMGYKEEVTKYGEEMMTFMKDKGLNPLKNLSVVLVQAPLFISFFFGLKGMVECPIESMAYGGLWWFTDLTVPDPLYILPILTSATFWMTFKLGADGIDLNAPHMKSFKGIFQILPLVMLPCTMGFSGAILVYWTTNNFISFCQAAVLKVPTVRTYFKIPATIKHTNNSSTSSMSQKGFKEGFRESLNNIKLSQDLSDRQRINDMISSRNNATKAQKK